MRNALVILMLVAGGCAAEVEIAPGYEDPIGDTGSTPSPIPPPTIVQPTGCAAGCDLPHALAQCLWSTQTCVPTTCDPGWADCDGDPANGCEAPCDGESCCSAE